MSALTIDGGEQLSFNPGMRFMLPILAFMVLVAGCKHTASKDGTRAAPQKRTVTPMNSNAGRIASVNAALHYVVIDYSLGTLPQIDQHLGIYRAEQKVGEVRITGPVRNSNIAGDIVAGEARVGDEVRP